MHLRKQVTQPLSEDYRIIPLTQDQVALVDLIDFERLACFNWYARFDPDTQTFYAMRKTSIDRKQSTVYMAREIMGATRGILVDHRDGNTLDNRRRNLRFASPSQNQANKKASRKNTSGIKGVYLDKRRERWNAMLFIGSFATCQEAADAYARAALHLHGEFARL